MIKALFSFNGRINRAKFFWYSMLLAGIIFILAIIGGIVFGIIFAGDIFANEYVISLIVGVIVSYPALALTIKRFHDIDRSGLWYIPVYLMSSIIIPLITMLSVVQTTNYLESILGVVSFAIGLVLLFKKGTVGPNQYGEDPIAEYNKTLEVETVGGQKKKSPTRHRLLALNLLIIGVLWFLVSIMFWVVGSGIGPEVVAEPGLIDVIKQFINRGLGFLSLLGIPGTIVGIVLLNRK